MVFSGIHFITQQFIQIKCNFPLLLLLFSLTIKNGVYKMLAVEKLILSVNLFLCQIQSGLGFLPNQRQWVTFSSYTCGLRLQTKPLEFSLSIYIHLFLAISLSLWSLLPFIFNDDDDDDDVAIFFSLFFLNFDSKRFHEYSIYLYMIWINFVFAFKIKLLVLLYRLEFSLILPDNFIWILNSFD